MQLIICKKFHVNNVVCSEEFLWDSIKQLDCICYSLDSFIGTTHSVRVEEQLAFSDWINTNLGQDDHLDHILPLNQAGHGLYEAVKDGNIDINQEKVSFNVCFIYSGILLCKIVNHSCPDTVDERVINMKPNSVYKRYIYSDYSNGSWDLCNKNLHIPILGIKNEQHKWIKSLLEGNKTNC